MKMNPKVRSAVLVSALAAAAATAWATSDYRPALVPAYDTRTTEEAMPPAHPVRAEQALVPGEAVVSAEEAAPEPTPLATPVRTETRTYVQRESVAQPPIAVETQRLSDDERIQLAVMDVLAVNQHLSGKISVQSNDRVVKLSGWTRTSGQAWQAERDARRVEGVRYIQNEIRPRIGGSV